MSVMVILEMDGDPAAIAPAAAKLDARHPAASFVDTRVFAPTETGVIVVTVWKSAEAREAYHAGPAHEEALRASGLEDVRTNVRSRVYENATVVPA